jgi:WD40 repeat protein
MRSGELSYSLRKGGIGAIRWIAFSPDGRTVASINFEGAARMGDVHTGELKQSLLESSNGMWWIAFAPDGTTVWKGTADGTVRSWNAATGKLKRECIRYGKPIALSPDASTLAS